MVNKTTGRIYALSSFVRTKFGNIGHNSSTDAFTTYVKSLVSSLPFVQQAPGEFYSALAGKLAKKVGTETACQVTGKLKADLAALRHEAAQRLPNDAGLR